MYDADYKYSIFQRDNFKCQFEGCNICGCDNLELAHRISKGKTGQKYVKRYLLEKYEFNFTKREVLQYFINHRFNMVTSCKKHNDYFNVLYNPEEANKIIDEIIKSKFDEIMKSNKRLRGGQDE